ncbi:hypothetical protein MMPV_002923 [Pyropia vietnamensis]
MGFGRRAATEALAAVSAVGGGEAEAVEALLGGGVPWGEGGGAPAVGWEGVGREDDPWAGLHAAAVTAAPLPRLLRGGWASRLVADPGGAVAALRAAWASAEPDGGGDAAAAAAAAPVGGVFDVDAGMAVPPRAAAASKPTTAPGDEHKEEEEEEEEEEAERPASAGDAVADPDVVSVAVTPSEDAAIGRLAELVGGGDGGRERAIEAWLLLPAMVTPTTANAAATAIITATAIAAVAAVAVNVPSFERQTAADSVRVAVPAR